MKAASIEFERVSKVYGEVAAVHDVSFAIAPGTLVTLLGPSGCGKTTTLRMIAGLELPSRGTIRIGGVDVTRIPASERDVSMVFQSYALFPHMTVQENVSYGLTVSKLPRPQIVERTRAHESLAMGVSPRGAQALYRASQALAAVEGRDYVTPDDVKRMVAPVFAHRVMVNSRVFSGNTKRASQFPFGSCCQFMKCFAGVTLSE